jgi:phosphatidylglycerophosphatase A
MNRLRQWAVSCFYLGEFPFASGTAGSLGAVALYLLISLKVSGRPLSIVAAAAGLLFASIGIRLGRWAQEFYQERDPGEFVLDEAAGQMIALVGVTPLVLGIARWKVALAAFLFFRIFDVIKPFPVGRAERLHGGTGIVLDDCLAGIYAAVCVHVWFHYL